MNELIQVAVFRGLSDAMQVAVDTGNQVEARSALWAAGDAFEADQITEDQFLDLQGDYAVFVN